MNIDKDIPLPKHTRTPAPDNYVPPELDRLGIGDSTLIPLLQNKSIRPVLSIIRRYTTMDFTTQKSADGIRIWRTK